MIWKYSISVPITIVSLFKYSENIFYEILGKKKYFLRNIKKKKYFETSNKFLKS